MTILIRAVRVSDEASLSRICLLTADAGKSAEPLHEFGELPGLVYAVPYVKLPQTTWGFVLEDMDRDGEVVGYILGSKDTREFEAYAGEHWWPQLAEKYPPSKAVRPADKRYMELLRNMHVAPEANIKYAAAHLHIDILAEYQRKGWGRKLMETAINHLAAEQVEGSGVWLGLDPKNEDARIFYTRLGFKDIEGSPAGNMGIKFDDFNIT
ncbi:acyl-CoA N-acyltransferase [Mycena floridula]|nr:acyl-CoA N-acyltransferase [Mycena floridula]